METNNEINLDDVAVTVVESFPTLDTLEQRLSLQLYRALAEGRPVPRGAVAERLDIPIEAVDRILDAWPGVFSDEENRIVGYWGLALSSAYPSPHRITVGGRTLSAWCAWDTLFLPQLLGQAADIESDSPTSGTVRLSVSPERVERFEPPGARMSFLLSDREQIQKDVVSTFCHFVHFFPSREAGEAWITEHPRTFLLSIDEAHTLARRKNEAQYSRLLTHEAAS